MIVKILVAGTHRLTEPAGDFRAIDGEPSELVLEADSTGGEIEAEDAAHALFSFGFSSPVTVRLVGFVLRGRIELLSGDSRLEMVNCTLTAAAEASSADHSALRVVRGSAELYDVTFVGLRAGALIVEGGETTIWRGIFRQNNASNGGAVHASQGVLSCFGCVLEDNTAAETGGALFAGVNASVLLANQSVLRRNRALGDGPVLGATIFVNNESAIVSYALPAPLGSWIPAPFVCGSSARQPCPWERNALSLGLTLFTFESGGFDDNYPYTWYTCATRISGPKRATVSLPTVARKT